MFLNIESHYLEMYRFEIIFCGWFKGPLTDLFKPLLRKIYSHITLSVLVQSYYTCLTFLW